MRFTALSMLFLLMSQMSLAGMDVREYVGVSDQGPCSLNVEKIYFENNTRHPLNERISVEYNGEKFVLQHPPVISASQAQAFFNHDELSGIVPNSTGANALVVEMNQTEGQEGPRQATLIHHNWKSKTQQSWICKDLK